MVESVEDKLKQIVVKQLGVEESEIAPGAKFIDDLGADSLDIVELVMSMEESFGIDIPDEDTESLKTFGDALAYIKKAEGA